MCRKILYSPIETSKFQLKHELSAIILSWLLIFVIIAYSLWATYKLENKVIIDNEISSNNKLQVLSSAQDTTLASSVPVQIFNSLKNLSITIQIINDVVRDSCQVGDRIFWNGTYIPSISTNNISFYNINHEVECSCRTSIFVCLLEFNFNIQPANNWRSIVVDKDAFYFNLHSTTLTSLDNKHIFSFNSIGFNFITERYQLSGVDITSAISLHSITFNFNDKLTILSERIRGDIIGEVPTIIITTPSRNDYIVTFLAISFGLFGVISIINKLLFYSASYNSKEKDIELT